MILRAALVIGCIFCATNPMKAATLSWTGDTSSAGGGLVWNRPTLNNNPPTSLALAGGGEGYLALEFVVDTAGSYAFSVQENGLGTGDWDSVSGNILGFLYQTSFNPATPLTNIVTNGGPGAHSSWSASLAPGTDYWMVITGYCGTGSGPGLGSVAGCTGPATLEEGPFSASLAGPGNITALGQSGDVVPEPSMFGVLLGSLLLLGGCSVLKAKRAYSGAVSLP
jgi:hypothetical protein